MSNSFPVSIQLPLAQRCNHINGRGHRCRMFAAADEGLRPHHLGRLQAEQAKNDEALAELLGPLEDFSSPANVNFYLGNLLKLMARKKIDRRGALAQADAIANGQKALPDAPDSGSPPADSVPPQQSSRRRLRRSG